MTVPAPAPAWVVAGPPGAGKSTVAGLLLARLVPVPALLAGRARTPEPEPAGASPPAEPRDRQVAAAL